MHVYWAPEKSASAEIVEMAESFGISIETVWGVKDVPDKELMTLESIASKRAQDASYAVPRQWVMADASGLYVSKDCVKPVPSPSFWRYGNRVRVAHLQDMPVETEVFAHTVFVLVSPSGTERLFFGEAWGNVSSLPLLQSERVFNPMIRGDKPSYFERAFKRVLECGRLAMLMDATQ